MNKKVLEVPPLDQDGLRKEINALVKGTAIVLVLGLLVLGLWAGLAKLSGAVIASGVIKVEENAKLVQHPLGGVVKRILVREGQFVHAGDPLFELEDTEAMASYSIVSDQLAAELARLARLTAENADSSRIDYPAELLALRDTPSVAGIMQRENALFLARNKLFADQVAGIRRQRTELQAEISSLGRQIEAAKASLAYLAEQEEMYVSLQAQGFVSQAKLLDLKRSVSEKVEQQSEYESLRAQAGQKLADLDLRLGQINENRLAENSRDMVDAQNRILDLRERRRPYQDALGKQVIRAPADGTVNAMRIHTVGGVVPPREPILEITPAKTELVAEVQVSPGDIDEIRLGQSVDVEFSGLSRRSTPLMVGVVNFVSADLNSDPGNASVRYFVARVALTQPAAVNFELRPGMPVTTYFKTRDRTPLEMWLDPLFGGLRKAMRES